ncbi:MAG: sugar isomerase domain-containing protein [Planctomycetes bacterium]|nr:sugar isomerase domain-containing protein [Planctomycetota bacterium]
MAAAAYLERIQALIRSLCDEELAAIGQAAESVAERLAAGGRLHHFDTGHMKREPIRRAGGLVGLHPLELELEVRHRAPAGRSSAHTEAEQSYFYDREDLADYLIEKSNLVAGDVLVQVSNSGKEAFTVGVAAAAQARGVLVVALTSVAFSRELEARHSSGKRLFELADLVVDMKAPPGDALLELPGLATAVAPASGVMTAVTLWALMAEICARLTERGLAPAVYRSVNLPDGWAFNREQIALYESRGY